jgi:hypothetical protein
MDLLAPVLPPELTFGLVPIEEVVGVLDQPLKQTERELIHNGIEPLLELLTGHTDIPVGTRIALLSGPIVPVSGFSHDGHVGNANFIRRCFHAVLERFHGFLDTLIRHFHHRFVMHASNEFDVGVGL